MSTFLEQYREIDDLKNIAQAVAFLIEHAGLHDAWGIDEIAGRLERRLEQLDAKLERAARLQSLVK